jgi:glycosyltransferase involved in cell wall biosynthesis
MPLTAFRPGFSLVVPLQDEESTIGSLLDSVARQTLLPDEVILVDAGSRDRTAEVIRQFRGPIVLKLVSAARVFPGVARNLGVEQASQEWVAFTDGGIRLEPDWLAELARATSSDVDVVFGNCDPICDTFFRECAAIAYVAERNHHHGTRGFFIASSAVRRAAFRAVGGFPAYRSAEDLVFMERLVARFRFSYAPTAIAHWEIAGSVTGTYRRFREYACHNIVAGRARHWQLGIARLYGGLTTLAAAALLLGAGGYALVLVPVFFLARALKTAWMKRRSFEFPTVTPGRVAGAAFVLAVIDAATIVGSLRWVSETWRRSAGSR